MDTNGPISKSLCVLCVHCGYYVVLDALIRATPVLCLTRVTEPRIRTVLEQNIGAGLVIENAAETIAETRRGQPRRDTCLVDKIHIGALLDQQLEHPVPAAITGTVERILVERGDGLRIDA